MSWFCDHKARILRRIGTDTGCAECRRVERMNNTHTNTLLYMHVTRNVGCTFALTPHHPRPSCTFHYRCAKLNIIVTTHCSENLQKECQLASEYPLRLICPTGMVCSPNDLRNTLPVFTLILEPQSRLGTIHSIFK